MTARRRRRALPRPRTPTSRSPNAGSSCAERRRDCSWRRPGRASDGTGGPSLRRVSDDRVIAVAKDSLVQKLHVLADRARGYVLVEAPFARFECAQLDVREALDLQVELEEIGRDRPKVLRVV